MAITAAFGTFSKKVNSTKQCNSWSLVSSINLKQPCSIMKPAIKLLFNGNPTSYNYCYIAHFNRYYYVSDWVSITADIWEAQCTVDPMAAWKSYIIGGSHYVLRSASEYDEDIVDTLYPMTGNVSYGDTTGTSPFSTGSITTLIGIINNEASYKWGAATLYGMSSMGSLMKYMLGDLNEANNIFTGIESIWTTIQDPLVQEGISRSLANPGQFFTESYILPYEPDYAQTGARLKAGYLTLPSGITGNIVSKDATLKSLGNPVTLTLPDHPQAATRGKYLNLDPYSRYWLYLGPFGTYPIDSSRVYNDRTITCDVWGDFNGNVACKIMIGGVMADVLYANVKVSIPVGQTTMDVTNAVGAGTTIAMGAMRTAIGDPAGVIAGASGIASVAEAQMPRLMSKGNQGTFVNVFDSFMAYGEFHEIVDDMNTERGRPLCQVKTLSSLSGFCMCADAEVEAPCSKAEADIINGYLNSGFYIE